MMCDFSITRLATIYPSIEMEKFTSTFLLCREASISASVKTGEDISFSIGSSPPLTFPKNRASEESLEEALSEKESPNNPSILESLIGEMICDSKSPLIEKGNVIQISFPFFEEEEVLPSESLYMLIRLLLILTKRK